MNRKIFFLVSLVTIIIVFGKNSCIASSITLSDQNIVAYPELFHPDDDLYIPICLNTPWGKVCIRIRCSLEWSVLVQSDSRPHWLTLPGCTIEGEATDTDGHTFAFEKKEAMIQSIEQAMRKPNGTLKFFEVISSPTFPVPDEGEFRIVAKTYPVLLTANGPYVPLEVERVK